MQTATVGLGRAWWTVGLLSLLYVLSFIDRLILALLVSPLKADLGVSDVQQRDSGRLVTAAPG